MHAGEIVYHKNIYGYVKYIIRHVLDDNFILVRSYKSKIQNYFSIDEVIPEMDFIANYNGEQIYEWV